MAENSGHSSLSVNCARPLLENITGLQHVGLPTLDMDATLKFYGLLGFKCVGAHINEGNKCNFLRRGDLTIETYEEKAAVRAWGAIQHIALEVRNADEAFPFVKKICEENSYKMIDDHVMALPFWDKGIRYFNIEGPNHEVIEFCEIVQ